MKSEKQLLTERNKRAEKLGEGSWRSNATGEWCVTDVTFYPTTKLWINEANERREITLAELRKNYSELKI